MIHNARIVEEKVLWKWCFDKYPEHLAFYIGPEKLNPVPAFLITRLTGNLIGGFISYVDNPDIWNLPEDPDWKPPPPEEFNTPLDFKKYDEEAKRRIKVYKEHGLTFMNPPTKEDKGEFRIN
jgi:hypothetical protein